MTRLVNLPIFYPVKVIMPRKRSPQLLKMVEQVAFEIEENDSPVEDVIRMRNGYATYVGDIETKQVYLKYKKISVIEKTLEEINRKFLGAEPNAEEYARQSQSFIKQLTNETIYGFSDMITPEHAVREILESSRDEAISNMRNLLSNCIINNGILYRKSQPSFKIQQTYNHDSSYIMAQDGYDISEYVGHHLSDYDINCKKFYNASQLQYLVEKNMIENLTDHIGSNPEIIHPEYFHTDIPKEMLHILYQSQILRSSIFLHDTSDLEKIVRIRQLIDMMRETHDDLSPDILELMSTLKYDKDESKKIQDTYLMLKDIKLWEDNLQHKIAATHHLSP